MPKTSSSKGKPSSSPSSSIKLTKVKGENFYRDAKQVKRLNMLKGGKPIRDKDGKIIRAAEWQKGEDETKPGRVQPDRRWFGELLLTGVFFCYSCNFCTYYPGNTRVISQTALDHFREALQDKKDDPFSVLLKRNKLPMQLLDEGLNPHARKVSYPLCSPLSALPSLWPVLLDLHHTTVSGFALIYGFRTNTH
jgi:nuclear GTP-binding protein